MTALFRAAHPRAPHDRSALNLADLTALVQGTAENPDLWLPKLQLPTSDDRWWTRLSADSRVDVWLLSWLPGQATELHDHGDSSAAFTVVRGRLTEVRVDAHGRRSSCTRRRGPVIWLAPGVVHDVRGAGRGPAVSIHAYSPPLTTMNYFRSNDRNGLDLIRTVRSDEPEHT